jgi:Asp-tRNA(Asn)/Glu-tRNA(Gln) amidotransferase A subunit family amidase
VTIAAREPVVRAWVVVNETGAREAADASTACCKSGKPLSPIDSMPIGIKDLPETRDMPTRMGCVACQGNFPERDNAGVWALREAGARSAAAVGRADGGRRWMVETIEPAIA